MHFHGGGYSDVKGTTGSWRKAFDEFEQSDAWICGYKELPGGTCGSCEELKEKWNELIGNGAYICKPGTPLTEKWYSELNQILDSKLEQFILHPASSPGDRAGSGSGYPLGWNEILGQIFHRICYTYKEKLMRTLPFPMIWIIDTEKGVMKLLHA
jgi:hypothetical protein